MRNLIVRPITLLRLRARLIVMTSFAALLYSPSPGWTATAPDLGAAQSFAVLGASTVTNTGATTVTGDLGVSPGTAITGFPPGVVTEGAIYTGADPVAVQAHNDASIAYIALVASVCDVTYLPVQELGGLTLTPGVYCFPSSAQLTGTLTLDAQGSSDAVFIFKIGSTLVTAVDSNILVINGGEHCNGANVFWAVGSSATLGTGTQFAGNILALASITLTTGASVSGSAVALTGAVTMDTNNVSVCNLAPQRPVCKDFVTGGGWITGPSGAKATFGVAGGIKHGAFWGHLTYIEHGPKNQKVKGTKVKGTGVTAYAAVDARTRHIEGTAEINGLAGYTYQVDVVDNGEPGRDDTFRLQLSNGYTTSGNLAGGNIQVHKSCDRHHDRNRCEKSQDDDENDDRHSRDGGEERRYDR